MEIRSQIDYHMTINRHEYSHRFHAIETRYKAMEYDVYMFKICCWSFESRLSGLKKKSYKYFSRNFFLIWEWI